jgi:hypothetical protein
LHELANDRLHRFREKLVNYTFNIKWAAGKEHLIADALSRAPVFPGEEDEDAEHVRTAVCRQVCTDLALQPLLKAAADPAYRAVVEAFRSGINPATRIATRAMANIWADLSLMDDRPDTLLLYQGTRIVVPAGARPDIIRKLHASHSGISKTYQLARQLYFWPGMKQAVTDAVQSCAICLAMLPSLPSEPLQETSIPEGPMSHVGLDLFLCQGEDWLLMVDRFSGFPFCQKLRSTVTGSVTKVLLSWFCEWGFPKVIRSDGGPQFRSEFREFCGAHDIEHELASPDHPQATGLAEAGVKNVKRLLKKCREKGEHFPSALLEWRNTPRTDGASPAQAFLGRRQRTSLPSVKTENSVPSQTILDAG